MRLRWLFGNFADPQYKLTAREQFDVSKVAHERYMPTGRLVWWTLLAIVLPGLLLMKLALPVVLDWLGYAGQSMPMGIGVGVIVMLIWPLSAWIYGHLYVEPVRRAMRERGLDLCVACGYVLNELPDGVDRCPECGRRRSPDGDRNSR